MVGHWCEMDQAGWTPEDKDTWLKGADESLAVVCQVATTWSMSLLCITSGICSQAPPTAARVRNYFQYLVVPTLLWVVVFKGILMKLLVLEPVPSSYWTCPVMDEWYLSALCLWRAATFLFFHRISPWVLMLLSQVVSFASGYCWFGGKFGQDHWVSELFQPGISLGFLPYFVVGYLFPFEPVLRAIPEPRMVTRLLLGVAVVAWSLLVAPVNFGGDPHFPYVFTSNHYADMASWEVPLYWHGRLVRWAVDMVPSFAVLLFVMPRGELPFTWAGPHTLYVYLFHHVALGWRLKIMSMFTIPVVTSAAGHVLVIALNVSYCVLSAAGLSSAVWRMLFDWMLKPMWLDPLANAWQKRLEKKG
mmetsp:Transcript_617/g.2026  ORF Transcript_617/g.2026 Transcript_617/m.2026 type:complete len:360 (-) Transcript_617:229-1308(-)